MASSIDFDGTPMRIPTDGRAASVDIYVTSLEARGADGIRMVTYPTISQPLSTKESGILPTIPISDLHIDALLAGQGFRFFLIKRYGANVYKAATKMLTAELQNRREPLVVAILCAVHTLNNCTIWGWAIFHTDRYSVPPMCLKPGT